MGSKILFWLAAAMVAMGVHSAEGNLFYFFCRALVDADDRGLAPSPGEAGAQTRHGGCFISQTCIRRQQAQTHLTIRNRLAGATAFRIDPNRRKAMSFL